MPEKELLVVPAINRALDILEYLGTSNQSVSIKELATALNIPSASCFRSVKNLLARGYISEDHNISGQYLLGFNILKLSEQLQHKIDIHSMAISSMRKTAIETNHAVQLAVLEEGNVIYIEQILPINPVKVIAPLRTIIPVNVSAAGKILYAFLPYHIRANFLKSIEFIKLTDNSITDKASFSRQLEIIEQTGISFDNEEFSIGIGCLAVPIFNYNKQCVASLGITGTICDYQDPEKKSQMENILKKSALEISCNMGYTP
ncbi:MAG: IclR family transcriptional regulator [Ruminiclostridium sp.]